MDPLVTMRVSRVAAKLLGLRPCRNGRFWRKAVIRKYAHVGYCCQCGRQAELTRL